MGRKSFRTTIYDWDCPSAPRSQPTQGGELELELEFEMELVGVEERELEKRGVGRDVEQRAGRRRGGGGIT